ERSGEIYQLKLDHDLGFAYAQLLDFSDINNFSGWLVNIYDYYSPASLDEGSIPDIVSSPFSLGPIRLPSYPTRRGKAAWRLIGRSNEKISSELPGSKHLGGNITLDNNWNNLSPWFKVSGQGLDSIQVEYKYSEIRQLETGILNTQPSVVLKVSMKSIIDSGKDVSTYYDLNNTEIRVPFIQLINTYYSLAETKELLKLL
ncbi:MAG: hypothetical protein AAGD28_22130, partial [Bacteroidota bacterium]